MSKIDVKGVSVFNELININSKSELAEALAMELLKYSIFDIQEISARLEREMNWLPSPYKEKVRPYFIEQYFGSYFRALGMYNRGEFSKIGGNIKDIDKFRDYCRMVLDTAPVFKEIRDKGREDTPYGHYYFILGCYLMFVMEEPGHPVGTPFPGGFIVEKVNGEYLCPIRDKEKDVEFSICNFCPAKQRKMPE
jgi:uncharacterized protein (UPF0305 family)